MRRIEGGVMHSTWRHRSHAIVFVGILVVLAVAAVVAVGCGDSSETASSGDGTGSPKVVVYDLPYFPYTSLDPGKEYWFNVYHAQVYESLTTVDQNGEVVPQLAESWEASEGGKVWTFQLRDDVTFHGGYKFTSADVKFSFERSMELEQGAAFLFINFEEVTTPDDYTVVFRFSKPMPAANMHANVDPPAFVYSKEAFEKDGDKAFMAGTETAGSGPYTLVKAETMETQLQRFDGYWGGWEGDRAKAPDIAVIRQVTEPSVMLQQLQNGDAQIISGVPAESVDSIKEDPNLKFMSAPWWVMDFFFVNTKTTPTTDANLREALYYAFPYEQVQQLVYKDLASPASGIIPQGMLNYELQNEAFGFPEQDMDKARAALAKSAYPDGGVKLLTLVDEGVASNMQIAQLFKAAAAELNITLDCRYQSSDVIFDRGLSDNPPQSLYISTYGMYYPGQGQAAQMMFGSWGDLSYVGELRPEIIDLGKEATSAEATDMVKGMELVIEAEKIARDEHTLIFAGNPQYRAATAKNITWPGFNPLWQWVVYMYEVQVD